MSTNNTPFNRIQLGSISATVWKNTDQENRAYYGVTFQKRYQDAKGEWQSSASFRRDDLLVIAKASEKAYDVIQEAQIEDRYKAREQALSQQATANAR